MSVFQKLVQKETAIAVVGLGYVGLPIAVAFAQKGLKVIGFDTDKKTIDMLQNGIDPTFEVDSENLKYSNLVFTLLENDLSSAEMIIVTVPTPINQDHTPDLSPLISASTIIGRNMSKGCIVVYESTVYPGCTEYVCQPLLEKNSGLTCGIDFKIGYSPERINPGDKLHKLENICKIISACDYDTLDELRNIYGLIVSAGTWSVSNIRTAEAVKVSENSQRDVNIAFVNELAQIFDKMDIDTNEVIDAMNTKWNALGFRPGLVGGHCIGVDPYYFVYQAERLGLHSQIILNGRIINDQMGEYIANQAVRKMVLAGLAPKNSKVVVLGITFKENCRDIRNSKVFDIIEKLRTYGITPDVVDPIADDYDVKREYGLQLKEIDEIKNADCIIVAVGHDIFKSMGILQISKMFGVEKEHQKILVDVKGLFSIYDLKRMDINYWRL